MKVDDLLSNAFYTSTYPYSKSQIISSAFLSYSKVERKTLFQQYLPKPEFPL